MASDTSRYLVRLARKKDVPAIAALDAMVHLNHDSERTWKLRVCRKQEAIVLVSVRPDTREVIGYLFALIVGSYKRLMDVTVFETHRRRGIGTQLLGVLMASPGGISLDAMTSDEGDDDTADFLRANNFEVCRNFMFVPGVVRYVWKPSHEA